MTAILNLELKVAVRNIVIYYVIGLKKRGTEISEFSWHHGAPLKLCHYLLRIRCEKLLALGVDLRYIGVHILVAYLLETERISLDDLFPGLSAVDVHPRGDLHRAPVLFRDGDNDLAGWSVNLLVADQVV